MTWLQFCANCGTYLFRIDSKTYVNVRLSLPTWNIFSQFFICRTDSGMLQLRAFQNLNVWDLDIEK